MRGAIRVLISSIVVLVISGCNGVIHKTFNIDETPPNSISIDARQRVVLVTEKGGKASNEHVVCAEPSPDVFSTLAAAASADIGIGEKKVGFSGSLAEAASALGPRTQTIQLLRDGLFRACEAYMNGIIDWREYKLIVTRYDEAMITTLAIDGLMQSHKSAAPLKPGTTAGAGEDSRNTSAGFITTEGEGSSSTLSPSSSVTTTSANKQESSNVPQIIKEILFQYYELQLNLQDKIIKSSELQAEMSANELKLKKLEINTKDSNN